MAPRKSANTKVSVKSTVIPQKKRAAAKPENPHEKWAEMQKAFGLEDDEMPEYLQLEIANWDAAPVTRKSRITRAKPNKPLTHVLHAEATLKSLVYPMTPQEVRKCKREECGDLFRTPYQSVAYCSDYCRADELGKKFGIEYIADQYESKNEIELWMGQVPPAIIPSSALAVMKFLVLDSEARSGETIEPWSPNKPAAVKQSNPVVVESPPEIPAPIVQSPAKLSIQDRLANLRSRSERASSNQSLVDASS